MATKVTSARSSRFRTQYVCMGISVWLSSCKTPHMSQPSFGQLTSVWNFQETVWNMVGKNVSTTWFLQLNIDKQNCCAQYQFLQTICQEYESTETRFGTASFPGRKKSIYMYLYILIKGSGVVSGVLKNGVFEKMCLGSVIFKWQVTWKNVCYYLVYFEGKGFPQLIPREGISLPTPKNTAGAGHCG